VAVAPRDAVPFDASTPTTASIAWRSASVGSASSSFRST
jgi:hypothetical protein